MGAVVVMNAAIARGPASAFPLVSRTVHRWLDVVVMLLLVGAAFQPVLDVDSTGRLLLCGIAFVMFFIWLNSDFAEKAISKKNKKRSSKLARSGWRVRRAKSLARRLVGLWAAG